MFRFRHKGCSMIRPLLWLPLLALSTFSAFAQDASLEKRVMKLHAVAGGDWCDPAGTDFGPDDRFQSWTFNYLPSWDLEGEPEEVTLFRVWCMSGAYNVSHSYYILREFEGLMPVAFAAPSIKIRYENEDDIDSPLLGVDVTGMIGQTVLVNSHFDPETLNISSHSYWRGIGDASSVGIWTFRDGEFALVHYEVDASYDGEVNLETIVDYLGQ